MTATHAPFTRRNRLRRPPIPAANAPQEVTTLHALREAERCLTRTAQDERDLDALRLIRSVLHGLQD